MSQNFGGSTNQIAELFPEKAFALHNVVELDGRVGHYPVSARGFAPCNCYLLREDDGALLLDTGFAAHRQAIFDQLASLIGETIPLSFVTLRVNDFLSVCNAIPIAQRFNVEHYYAMARGAVAALDFYSMTTEEAQQAAARVPLTLIGGQEWLQIGRRGLRSVKLLQAPIRLINTRWVYDPVSRILFTSDMFAHSWSARPETSWVLDSENDETTEEDVRRFMLSTRYWWLEGARTDELRRGLARIFEEYDVETIAPGYGKVLRGAAVVARHYHMLDEVLRKLDRGVTPPRYVAHNEEHYG